MRAAVYEDRPAEADGKRFGDFETDLIVDAYGHAILVLPERMTVFVTMEKLPYGKRAKPLAKTVVRLLYAYRKYLKTITTDNGSEFAAHLDITAGLRMKGLDDVTVYFADSYCSWQKGAVENVNKLIRQYIPKKSNFNNIPDQYVKNVAKKLNLRPRKKLGFSNPKTEFSNKSLILHLPVEPAGEGRGGAAVRFFWRGFGDLTKLLYLCTDMRNRWRDKWPVEVASVLTF